jgi:hypothetical protein
MKGTNLMRGLGAAGISIGAVIAGLYLHGLGIWLTTHVPQLVMVLLAGVATVELAAQTTGPFAARCPRKLFWLVPLWGIGVLVAAGFAWMLADPPAAITGAHREWSDAFVPLNISVLFGSVFALPVGLLLATVGYLVCRRVAMSSPTIDTAISAGVCAPIDTPIGLRMR